MKYLKMLGLAAVAAMALMAFGAGTASATTICTTTTTPCGSLVKEIDASLTGTATLTNPSTSTTYVSCTSSTVKGKIETQGANETASGKISELSWGGCSTTTDTVTKGSLEVHHISGTHNGTVTAKDTEVTVQLFGVTCTYGAGAGLDLGILVGTHDPQLTIHVAVEKTAGGFLCPTETEWNANYTVTNHTEIFVEP